MIVRFLVFGGRRVGRLERGVADEAGGEDVRGRPARLARIDGARATAALRTKDQVLLAPGPASTSRLLVETYPVRWTRTR